MYKINKKENKLLTIEDKVNKDLEILKEEIKENIFFDDWLILI